MKDPRPTPNDSDIGYPEIESELEVSEGKSKEQTNNG